MSACFVLPMEATHGKLRVKLERIRRQQTRLDSARRECVELANEVRRLERMCGEIQAQIDRDIAAAQKEMLSTEGMTIQ